MGNRIVDYIDEDGIKRRVLVPADVDPGEGIRLSCDIDRLYENAPKDFVIRLVAELWAVGLVTKDDYKTPGAETRIRAALLAAVKHDTMSIINFTRSPDNG